MEFIQSIRITSDEEEIIIALTKKGFNTVEIAKKLGRCDSTIGRFLKKKNIPVNYNKCKLRNDDKAEIIRLYESGLTAKEILPLYQNLIMTESTIMNIVKKESKSRPRGVAPNCNVNYFENIDSEAKAYFLGFMLADGNVCKLNRNTDQYVIQIGLKLSDIEILKRFADELQSTNTISIYNTEKRHECHLSVSSKKMASDLCKFGIVPNKTFSAELCEKIPAHLYRHYIRGIFDGDGTVYTKFINDKYLSLHFGFYGTFALVNQIMEYLKNAINISPNKITDKGNVSFVTFSKPSDIKNFYNLIYCDSNFHLQRKKNVFDNYAIKLSANTEVTK